jgi:site-specific DNA-methyltransferase (adenine-specific)
MSLNITNEDNMKLMARYSDNHFDLAIVDPPYGIGFGKFNRTNKDSSGKRFKANKYKNSNWDDSTPKDDYFDELKRVSLNQIVFGGNYFYNLAKKESSNLKAVEDFNEYIRLSSEKWLFWHKQNPVPNFADGELAWLSDGLDSFQIDYRYYGNIEGNTSATNKIHPTQKPVGLYRLILENYAKKGDKILDTHLGSGSIAIACHDYGFDLTACELDKDYYESAMKRIDNHTSQIRMDL